MAKKLPVYSICAIQDKGVKVEEFMMARFREYLSQRNYLLQPHGHSFYHIVFFTKGGGKQFIDFTSFPVKPGQLYFMNPGQVHNWQFAGEVDGYIINFTESFFHSFISEKNYLERFPFFAGYGEDQVVQLKPALQQEAKELLEKLLKELAAEGLHTREMKLTLLVQFFILISRNIKPARLTQLAKPGYTVVRNFQRLVNEKYAHLRLPGEYASLLFVTPNYLNALCKDLLGKSAGEVIRERVMLEAKRLLVNAAITISEIADQLNFQDNSYFTRFFKKYAGKTPEAFRRDQQINQVPDQL